MEKTAIIIEGEKFVFDKSKYGSITEVCEHCALKDLCKKDQDAPTLCDYLDIAHYDYYNFRRAEAADEQPEPQEEKAAPEVEQPKQKAVDLIPEGRLQELLSILLPWGYCNHEPHKYTGVSPYIGDTKNIITIVANDPEGWDSVFVICMDRFTDEEDEENGLGFYKGIMKVIAPELVSNKEKFKGGFNVLDFNWADDDVWDNRFPAKM